jgi:crotonobetainyl-CoA:carnitine CoA-transferase CaiB-like acyl-CoA transferase
VTEAATSTSAANEAELERPAPSAAAGPLAGLRVLELGGEQADYAGLLCAGLGATVIKVEPPDGSRSRQIGPFHGDDPDPERSLYFWGYNRGKRSVVIDLASAEGRDRLRGLLAEADVLIDATSLGELAAFRINPADYPALVHARLTPFGEDGPWAGLATSDLVSLALGGVVMNCGYDPDPAGHYDLPPVAPQAWHSFHIAGEQLVIGIVSALIYRLRSGVGQKVSVAIHEAVAKNTEMDLMSWVMLRQPVYRQTCRHALATITNPSISYTKDGRWNLSMHVGPRDERYLRPFLEGYGLAEGMTSVIAEPPPGVRAVAGSTGAATAGVEYVQRLTRRFRYDDLPWQEAQRAGLLWSPIRKPHENAVDGHWLSRGTFADVPHPELDATLRYPVSKWISTRGSWTAGRRAPLLGEDDKLLRDGWLPREEENSRSGCRTDPSSPDRPLDSGTGADATVGETPGAGGGNPGSVRDNGVDSLLFGGASADDDGLSALGKPFPLAGVRILDFSWFLASAGATRFLAALGADVLKVEWKTHPDSGRGSLVPEGGRAARDGATGALPALKDPGIGGQYNNKNPGKRGLSLNAADPRGLEIARALLARCDVVAEGFSPGVLERWGLGYAEQRKIRPDIIYVKQSGMGAFGTYGRFRAVGPIAAALSGMSEMSGLPSPAPPAGWGYSFLDWFGAYSMALSVLAALYHRDLTGEGQWIDASQTEAGIMLTQVPVLDWAANGRAWERSGNRAPYQSIAPQGIYRCAGDDRWIAITCASQDQWRALAHLAGHDDWMADPRFGTAASRLAHHDALDAGLDAWTRSFEPYELMMRLQSAGVPAGVCQTAGDRCDNDPQLRHLGWLTELTGTRIGRWPLAEVPVRMSRTPPYLGGRPDRAAPLYGEDNAAILTGLLGMSEDEVAELTEQGVL